MVRLLLHGGGKMLGRAVQLTFPHYTLREELIRDSTTACVAPVASAAEERCPRHATDQC